MSHTQPFPLAAPRRAGAAQPHAHRHGLLCAAVAVASLTAAATVVGAIAPGLAIATRPHPVLHGTLAEAAAIVGHNLRLLCLPVILAATRFARGRVSRLLGDAVVAAFVIANPIVVGLALGRDQGRLLPYLTGLPLEWAALTVAAGAWLAARRGQDDAGTLAAYTAGVVVLATIAAALETFTTPHVGS